MNSEPRHEPVLLNQVLRWWHSKPGGFYVDATVGLGGHSRALLEKDQQAQLCGLDQDPEALSWAEKRLGEFSRRVVLTHCNYKDLAALASAKKWPPIDGILVDLGVSSLQLDSPERGFSLMKDGPLDMRMNPNQKETAASLLQRLSAQELAKILKEFGEVKNAAAVAVILKKAIREKPTLTTRECALRLDRQWLRGKKKIHPATQIFQALRIAVNGELAALDQFLLQVPQVLARHGRLVVISFHSLEDRRVKEAFLSLSRGCVCPPQIPVCVCGKKPAFELLGKKAVSADAQEIASNPRSRSAKLRAIEKIAA